MYSLTIENQYGDLLELTHNPRYSVKSITGIDPPDAVINTTHNAGYDGSIYNSAYASNRTITITLCINYPAEDNRINLYRFFKSKFPVRLYIANGTRNVYIDGYTQSFQVDYFVQKEVAQITVMCPYPFFVGAHDGTQGFSQTESLFKFPFAIEQGGIPFSELLHYAERRILNSGDVITGGLISMQANGYLVNPRVYNVDTGEYIGVDYTLEYGDEVLISTIQGNKKVQFIHNGITTNIINKLSAGSSWLHFIPGYNAISVGADNGVHELVVDISINSLFEGV